MKLCKFNVGVVEMEGEKRDGMGRKLKGCVFEREEKGRKGWKGE